MRACACNRERESVCVCVCVCLCVCVLYLLDFVIELKGNILYLSRLMSYGTYHIGDQGRLRRACASAQSRQSLRCSHT